MSKRNWELIWLMPQVAAVSVIGASVAQAADYFTAEQAQKTLFPDADEFVSKPVQLTDEQKDEISKQAGVRQRKNDQQAWRALKKGKLLGWFIVDDVIGKHEYITYGVALSPEGKVLGIEIMSYRETHGGQVREASWRKKFVGKSLGEPFKLNVDVPNISGATLSCRNLLDGVKRLLVLQKVALSNG